MGKVKVEINYSEVGKFLKSNGMKDMLDEIATEIASRCGEHYASDTRYMGTRVIASVFTKDEIGRQDNLDNNTILKNLR